ncbi:ABC transporter substrate-binding protein [Catenulispora pinisilvae]|uniref:ABC transporter substrate-binding protein n=1 Tax=Catenulispora pinisilvae TaxID=2705253 RepID=UPI001891DB59|nr:ABC transporter substrate-binding protein [Catenulispora pinisilvae]
MTAAVLVMAATVPACSSSTSSGAAAGGSKTFTYWSMWKENEPQATVIKEALASYKAATGVTVTVEWHGRGVLDDVAAALKAGKPVPDLSDGSINTILGAAAEGVGVTDLTTLYRHPVPGENQLLGDIVPDKYMPLLSDATGAEVMVPYEVASEAVFFDKTKYPQLSANPPQTWDQFVDLMGDIKAKGQAPLALDASPGNAAYWVEWMFERELGPGQFKRTAEEQNATAAGGDSRWDDARLLDGAQKLETLIKGGDFAPGWNTEDASTTSAHGKDQQNAWAAGKAALILGGTWVPSETKRTENVDSFVFPAMPAVGGVRSDDSAGVNFFGFAVPKAGKNADAAEKFILYFMAKNQLSKISTEAGNMTPRIDIPAPSVLATVQTALTNRTVFPDQDALMRDDSKWYTTVFQPASVAFMVGKLTPQQLISKLKSDSTAFWAQSASAK